MSNHPEDGVLILFLEGKISDVERERVHAHLASCSVCAGRFAVTYRLMKASAEQEPADINTGVLERAKRLARPRVPAPPHRKFAGAARLALACSVLLITGSAIYYYAIIAPPDMNGPPDRFRIEYSERSVTTINPGDGSIISQSSFDFQWHHMPGAVSYRFSLFDENGTLLFETATMETTLIAGSEIGLAARHRYLWRVDAVFIDDGVVQSGINVFTYAP